MNVLVPCTESLHHVMGSTVNQHYAETRLCLLLGRTTTCCMQHYVWNIQLLFSDFNLVEMKTSSAHNLKPLCISLLIHLERVLNSTQLLSLRDFYSMALFTLAVPH